MLTEQSMYHVAMSDMWPIEQYSPSRDLMVDTEVVDTKTKAYIPVHTIPNLIIRHKDHLRFRPNIETSTYSCRLILEGHLNNVLQA